MKKILLILTATIILAAIALVYSIGATNILFLLNYPQHSFESDLAASPLDYNQAKSWALFHDKLEPTNDPRVDVFFVHSSSYFRGEHWNNPLQKNTTDSHNRKWMMLNMASAFHNYPLYAPKYREASIYAFFDLNSSNSKKSLALAYEDIRRAFNVFRKKNKGRPFILAAHSQGSYHVIHLLSELENSAESSLLVAAYIPGGVRESMVENLKTPICKDAKDYSCFVSWSSYGEKYEIDAEELLDPYVCVNPINWKINGSAKKQQHQGMLEERGTLSFKVLGSDNAEKDAFPQPKKFLRAYTPASCDRGILRVEIDNPEAYKNFSPDDYHNYDYSLFHRDITINARLRVDSYREDGK